MTTSITCLRTETLALTIVMWKKKCFSLFVIQNFQNSESKQGRPMKDGFNYADPLAGACAPGVQTTKWKM